MIGFSFLQRLSNSIILSTTIIIVFVIQYYASWLRMTTLEAKWMSKLWSPTENDDRVEIRFILLLLLFFFISLEVNLTDTILLYLRVSQNLPLSSKFSVSWLIGSMCSCICLVMDDIRHQNVERTKKRYSRSSQVCRCFFYHN